MNNILKIKKQKSGGTLALFEKDSYLSVSQSVSQWVSEKAKLIRGDPPKIDFKKKGEPPKITNYEFFSKTIDFY
jgi:hypothetical protein